MVEVGGAGGRRAADVRVRPRRQLRGRAAEVASLVPRRFAARSAHARPQTAALVATCTHHLKGLAGVAAAPEAEAVTGGQVRPRPRAGARAGRTALTAPIAGFWPPEQWDRGTRPRAQRGAEIAPIPVDLTPPRAPTPVVRMASAISAGWGPSAVPVGAFDVHTNALARC